MEQILSLDQQEIAMIIMMLLTALSFALALCAYLIAKKNRKTVTVPSGVPQDYAQIQSDIDLLITKQKRTEESLDSLTKKHMTSTVHRFNPFKDSGVGGNQSFSLAHVDRFGNGFVVTQLYSRDFARVQAKEVRAWETSGEALPEEKTVLEQAKENKH